MRSLLSICAMTFLTATVFAQASKKVENWQIFSPISDEFSVETPLALDQRGDSETKSSRKYSGTINGVYFFVFSDPLKKENESQQSYLEMVRETLPKIGMPSDFGSAGMNSGGVSFKDTFGFWHQLRLFRDGKRTYVAHAVAFEADNESASRFIRTFSPGQKQSFVQQAPLAEHKVEDLRVVPTGIGNGSTGTSPASVPSSSGTSLKIISKPRPGYTDIARMFGIQGTVILEVTFLESGQIGTVKALSQLPFGLTQTGIEAASKITFQPATENGIPITVTKRLEYSYAIY